MERTGTKHIEFDLTSEEPGYILIRASELSFSLESNCDNLTLVSILVAAAKELGYNPLADDESSTTERTLQ